MRFRVWITLVVALLVVPAEAEGWHAVAVSPRSAFPAVTVDLGYSADYVPAVNTPITLRATAGDRPFDGYIGFHYAFDGHRTYDLPVVARAVLRPHEQWTFTSFTSLEHSAGTSLVQRLLVIEWRDRAMRLAAETETGTPPWLSWNEPLQPLRIVTAGTPPATTLGTTALTARADSLSERAQWYAGFADVVAPLEVWLDLPIRVREAIFGSGVEIILYGLPRPNQKISATDAALLPVTFAVFPGSYDVPWPYGSGRIATSLSWKAKNDAWTIGSTGRPYMARNGAAVWTPDENAIAQQLPAMQRVALRKPRATGKTSIAVTRGLQNPSTILRAFSSELLVGLSLLACVVAYLAVRGHARAATVAATVVAAMLIVGMRSRVRPASGTFVYDIRNAASDGIVQTIRIRRDYGRSPLAPVDTGTDQVRNSVSNAMTDMRHAVEIRSSETPARMGTILTKDDIAFDAITRWSRRRELGKGATVNLVNVDGAHVRVSYSAPSPIDTVAAEWWCGKQLAGNCYGEARVARSTHGMATITDSHLLWPGAPFAGEVPYGSIAWIPGGYVAELSSTAGNVRHAYRWINFSVEAPHSFRLGQRGTSNDQRMNWTFALPTDSPQAASVCLRAGPRLAAIGFVQNDPITLTWGGGTTTLLPDAREIGAYRYPIAENVYRDILAHGGVVRASRVEDPKQPSFGNATIEVMERTR